MLSTVFDGNDDINVLTERFMKKLDGCIALNFKKIRISKKKNQKLHQYNISCKYSYI